MPPAIPAGARVEVHGLSAKPEHNGKLGRAVSYDHNRERVGVHLDSGDRLLLRVANLRLTQDELPAHKEKAVFAQMFSKPGALSSEADGSAAEPTAPPPPAPPRDGSGSWDDLDEQQVMLSLSEEEARAVVGGDAGATLSSSTPSLEAALSSAVRRNELTAFANAPRYDRLVLSCKRTDTLGDATYTVEAGLDAFDGLGWWTTTDRTHADLASDGFVRIGAEALVAEYGGVMRFLELCRRLGPPRYTMKTALDPEAKPHVIAVVERLCAASALRCLLSCEAAAAHAS